MATCQALNMQANSPWPSHCLMGNLCCCSPCSTQLYGRAQRKRKGSQQREQVLRSYLGAAAHTSSMQDRSPSFKGPWHGTWAQPAVLWETVQPMFQQHRDDLIQVRHLTRKGLERREQDDKVFCFLPWCWVKR